jgi:hypothetical protein
VVGEGLSTVLLRGTKRKNRFRTVPIVSPAQQSLLAYALEHAKGAGDALFQPWGNARRDLAERSPPHVRELAGRGGRAALPDRAQAMGHKDTRMLERVYGRQTPDQLAALMARAMGLPPPSPRPSPPADAVPDL